MLYIATIALMLLFAICVLSIIDNMTEGGIQLKARHEWRVTVLGLAGVLLLSVGSITIWQAFNLWPYEERGELIRSLAVFIRLFRSAHREWAILGVLIIVAGMMLQGVLLSLLLLKFSANPKVGILLQGGLRWIAPFRALVSYAVIIAFMGIVLNFVGWLDDYTDVVLGD